MTILEDGSTDGSDRTWDKLVCCDWKVNHTDNLHEIRSYDGAILLSAADIFITLQDDDLPPAQNGWLLHLDKLFSSDKALGMVGMWCGFEGARYFGIIKGSCRPKRAGSVIRTSLAGARFQYAVGINQGPIAIRVEAYKAIGGFNYSYSLKGKPGIHFETELSLRMWESGWKVGVVNSIGWQRGVGGKGTASSPAKWQERKSASARNVRLVTERFPHPKLFDIARTANRQNKMLLRRG